MDIRHLRYFVGIADCGSLMRASEHLHVAQPALSVHISNLEVELRVKLMERNNRGVRLTPEGRLLYEKAKILLASYHDMLGEVRNLRETPSGTVTIGLPCTTSPLIAAQLYRRVRDELPEVTVYVTDASTAMLYELVQDGRLDFAILFNLPESAEFEQTALGVDEYCICGAPGMLPAGDTIEFDEVFNYPLVVSCQSTTWRMILDDIAERHGKRFEAAIETESLGIMRTIAISGEACSIMPFSGVKDDVAAGRLNARLLVNPVTRGVLSLARLKIKEPTAAMQAVGRILVDVVRETYGWTEPDPSQSNVTQMLRAMPSKVLPTERAARVQR